MTNVQKVQLTQTFNHHFSKRPLVTSKLKNTTEAVICCLVIYFFMHEVLQAQRQQKTVRTSHWVTVRASENGKMCAEKRKNERLPSWEKNDNWNRLKFRLNWQSSPELRHMGTLFLWTAFLYFLNYKPAARAETPSVSWVINLQLLLTRWRCQQHRTQEPFPFNLD